MGQAKNRGTQEERIEQAKQRKIAERAKFPETVPCNHCKADLHDISPLPTEGMQGIRLAGAAICQQCGSTTWILDGEKEAVAAIGAELGRGIDGMSMGFVKAPNR